MLNNCNWLTPTWPAPANVKALVTLRQGGFSQGPYESLNLGIHAGDDLSIVQKNRQYLREAANLPSEPYWLSQVHGTQVIKLDGSPIQEKTEADAAVSFIPNQIAVVTTGDCLPLLLCDKAGTLVAAVHAGWRGLASGVIEATVAELNTAPQNLLAWMGPAIGPNAFEVGDDVRVLFQHSQDDSAFIPFGKKWKLNIYRAASLRLNSLGITEIFGGDFCTFTDEERFFSYRRSPKSGRMASLIWLSDI